jgi:hypothetical protein
MEVADQNASVIETRKTPVTKFPTPPSSTNLDSTTFTLGEAPAPATVGSERCVARPFHIRESMISM